MFMNLEGWLLDVYIEGNKAVLWIKTENGNVVRLTDKYQPSFFIEPRDPSKIECLESLLSGNPNITSIEREKKYASLSMERVTVLHVYVDSVASFKQVLSNSISVEGVKTRYNVDLLHVQWYLFQKGISPTSKVSVTYDEKCNLLSISSKDDHEEICPPPFSSLIFNIQMASEKMSPDVNSDCISEITVLDEDIKPTKSFRGDEEEILKGFQEHVKDTDPDLLISEEVGKRLTYVLERARIRGLNLQLGREPVDIAKLKRLLPYSHKGRIHVDLRAVQFDGLAGLIEHSRFAMAPLGLSADWPAGKTVDSRQCYEAYRRGILIPEPRNSYRFVRTAKEVAFEDRGGLILSPKVGLHQNVAALDFESMYPHIIVKHNISYETATPDCIRTDIQGFLPHLIEEILARRLFFKHLLKGLGKERKEWIWSDQRQRMLKDILVWIYGNSGSFSNRFNNVACYEQINRLAREYLVKAMNTALNEGYEVIYGDCDSLFVKKPNSDRKGFISLAKRISHETGLPLVVDQCFKFLALLTQEADPNLEATRRYFGKLTNGELFYRGIELRRHDYPLFLKEFETNLMKTLLEADSVEQIQNEQYKKAFDLVVETCDKVHSGQVPADQLVITKVLGKPMNTYPSLFPYVVAAIQMAENGKRVKRNEKLDYVYLDAEHHDPFKRVVPAALIDYDNIHYDREKYTEMILDAAETILGVFGFNSNQLGIKKKPRNYLEEFKNERTQETITELSSFMEWD
jgi:DNA polymerase elongation subunit (family B)